MVSGVTLRNPEGGLLEEAGGDQSPPGQPEWNLPTWEDIVRMHSARVYRLAYRLTGNPHDAEDLTQEVFVRVFRSLSSYTPGTFEGWLHRITTNLFLDGARRKQRIRFEGLADEMAHRLPGSEPTPAQAFDDSHLDDDVQAALKALPPGVPGRGGAVRHRGLLVRGDRRHPGGQAGHGAQPDSPRARSAARRARASRPAPAEAQGATRPGVRVWSAAEAVG